MLRSHNTHADDILIDNSTKGNPGRDINEVTPAELNAAGHYPVKLTSIIRANCIDCAGRQLGTVKTCQITDCAFWPYRMGTNPFAKRESTPELKTKRQAAMQVARAARRIPA